MAKVAGQAGKVAKQVGLLRALSSGLSQCNAFSSQKRLGTNLVIKIVGNHYASVMYRFCAVSRLQETTSLFLFPSKKVTCVKWPVAELNPG